MGENKSNTFLKWIDNTWYHYKPHIIIGLFAIILVCVECNENFIEEHKIKGNYIGEFDSSASNPSIILYTAPLTTHFFFMEDEKSFCKTIKTKKRIWI